MIPFWDLSAASPSIIKVQNLSCPSNAKIIPSLITNDTNLMISIYAPLFSKIDMAADAIKLRRSHSLFF